MSIKNYLFILFCAASFLACAFENSKQESIENKIIVSNIDKKKEKDKEKEKPEKKDTTNLNLTDLNKKLDSLINLMNSKVIPYIDAQNSAQNKVLEVEITKINAVNSQSKLDLEAKQKLINQYLEEKNKSVTDIATLQEKVNSNSVILLEQKNQLRKEIAALQKQSFKIDEAILNSLGERLKITPGVEVSWSQTYKDYKVKRSLLSQADELLSKPYDVKVKQLISDIKTEFSSGDQFIELSKEKVEFLLLLDNYCAKSNALKTFLISVNKLNAFPDERDRKIENEIYDYIGYDYLISIIQKNKTDFNYNPIKNTVINCN